MGRTIAGSDKDRNGPRGPLGKSTMLGSVRGDGSVKNVDVDDFTNWRTFASLMEVTVWATIDSILWTSVNVLITVLFAGLALPWFFVQSFLIFLQPGPRDPMTPVTFKTARRSSVSSATPDFYTDYLTALSKENWTLSNAVTQKLAGTSRFDYDVATLFLHLSSLIYEPSDLLHLFETAWRHTIPDLSIIRFGHEGCCIMAVHSVSRNFVILVFKGTSPFDLTEWLTDASMRKSSARNGVLPGLVHTGFYTNFEFPSQDYIERPTLPIDHAFKSSMESGVPIDISTLWRGIDDVNSASEGGNCRHMWSDCLYPHLLAIRSQFPSGTKPNFWVTGHSLGAATATIFSSTLLWKRTQIGMNTTVPTMDWDKCFNIHGTYTFGTPRVADTDFQQAIVKAMHETSPKFQFYRVINANDIVCSVPGLSKKLGAFLRKRKRLPLSRRHRHSEQDELRPAGVTLSDFQHVGVAVYVGFRDGSIAYRGRDISDVVWNMGKEVLVSLWEIVGERGTVADKLWKVGVVTTGGVASLLRDHMPSEYLKNLKIAESKNPKGPHVDENALHF